MTTEAERRIHIGIDYGTSWSKLVFRDYEAPRGDVARIVGPTDATDGVSLQFPSTVTVLDGRLWFGWEAERRRVVPAATAYSSLKIRMAMPGAFRGRATQLPTGLDAQGLAVLTVLYLVQRAQRAASAYARSIGCRPRLSMTMGAPMSDLNDGALRSLFVDVVRAASDLLPTVGVDLGAGLRVADGAALAREALGRVRARAVKEWRTWVRSEVESALMVPFLSPAVRDGLFAAVDVGAGTTDASFFRITAGFRDGTWYKRGLAIFGARSGPPGVDAVDAVLAGPGEDPASLRMRENEILGRRGPSKGLSDIFSEIFGVYSGSFSRAYEKDPRQSAWSPFDLFVFGGGGKIELLRGRLGERPWPGLPSPPKLIPLEVPPDLRSESGGEPGSRGDPFVIAYGLSFIRADVPEASTPGEIPPFHPWREQEAGSARACGCGGANQDCPTCDGTGLVRSTFLPPGALAPRPARQRAVPCRHCGAAISAVALRAHELGCSRRPPRGVDAGRPGPPSLGARRKPKRSISKTPREGAERPVPASDPRGLVRCAKCGCAMKPGRAPKHAAICKGNPPPSRSQRGKRDS